MARSKQPPVKRESSSEYFNRKTATWEDANGSKVSVVNGHSSPAKAPVNEAHDRGSEAGVLQLVVAVAGIYASL